MDEAELRSQLEQLHPSSYGWAVRCCGHDSTEAKDVLQTAYMKVLQGRARYDGRASFKTWLFAVIRITALQERRRAWLSQLRLRAYQCERADEDQVDPGDQTDEAVRRLEDALERIPRRQREVLHLVFYQDMTVQEAAGVMGVSLGSARTHYERGKKRLRELLGHSKMLYGYQPT